MRILLAQDGSSDAAQAANLIRDITWPPNSDLRVISVIEPTVVTTWAGSVAGDLPEIDAQISAHDDDVLADVVAHLSDPNRTVEGALLRGRPASVIIDEARTFAADLVVVGSRGRGSIASLVLGSVSGEVIDHSPCPVLVARHADLARVIFAADGSPSAATAEGLLAQWPIFEDLRIRVVSVADVVCPWHTGIAPMMYGQVIEADAQDLQRADTEHQRVADASAARLRAAGRRATAELRSGDAASEIIAAASEWNADLVVLGSRGQTGWTRLLLGSVARNVVHGCKASILVVRERIDA